MLLKLKVRESTNKACTSNSMHWDQAKQELVGLFPDEVERGRIKAKLLELPEKRRLEYFEDTAAANKASLLALAGAGPATLPPLGLGDARQLLLQDYGAYFSMGKTTALLELWPRLYQLAQPVEGTEAGQEQDDLLYARIRRSMRPDCMMVFALDLQRRDLARLHHLEVPLGSDNPTILALRMLYSSVCQLGPWEDYGEFLENMQPQLRASLRPMHVLHFWQAAAGVGDAEHWIAAFTLDEVGAAQPEPKPDQPSQRGLSCRRFEDLENDGLAYIGQPGGPDLETGGSGDSTGRRASTDSDDVNDPGSTNPDAGEQQFTVQGKMALINDVSTDLTEPPTYHKNTKLGPLPADFIPIIQKAYPDLKPLKVDKDPHTVFRAAQAAAKRMPRWELTLEDEQAGIIEGVATTLILRFKDDFVFRVRPDGSGTVVDGRSKSRLGKGDFGANAKRIHTYFTEVKKELGI
ncbi:hypothetical protein WJX72_008251 [[Myrmecia] bisecta]|uniref:DUF1499 domain-containing protein n=1 Tax=[Myrmecia] bisecta TaxID=41462 RepID=A0AAW1Q7E0_9CHLO